MCVPGERCHVLVLEDDDTDFEHLQREWLKERPDRYRVVRGRTLAEAMRLAEGRAFDAVLTDLGLPDSSGVETVAALRSLCGDAPILALTGSCDEATTEEVLAAGGQDCLMKGEVTGRELTRALTNAIQRQQSKNQIESLLKKLSRSNRLLKDQAKKLRRKNNRLRRLNRMAGEFVENVSHDFRTPLTVINDYVNLLRDGIVGEVNHDQAEMLDKVAVRAEDLNHMVDDLLDVSRLDSGMLRCWRRKAEPAALLRRVQELVQKRAEVKGIEVEIDCPDGLGEVFCDLDKTDRVLANLMMNAVKFTPAGGTVRVWAAADPDERQVVLGVTDTGPGMEEEELAKVFERFEQSSLQVQPTARGFGLGLSIAQRFVSLSLGEMRVESKPGEGSTFAFTLPLAEPTEVFSRWLRLGFDPSIPIQVYEFTSESELTDRQQQDVSLFLYSVLRGNDLLLQVDRDRWLIMLLADESDAASWRRRYDKELQQANRNRPVTPLPITRMRRAASWNPEDPNERRLAEFRLICSRSEATKRPTPKAEPVALPC